MKPRKLQKQIVEALEDIKAREIDLIDVTTLTPMFDFVVIATADSGRQARALAMHVHDEAKKGGAQVRMEGENTDWVLVDCGDTVVHIMLPEARAHYNLEELWHPKRTPNRAGGGGAKEAKAKAKASSAKSKARGTEPKPRKPRAPKAQAAKPKARTSKRAAGNA
jgi:ribosome-associated protein